MEYHLLLLWRQRKATSGQGVVTTIKLGHHRIRRIQLLEFGWSKHTRILRFCLFPLIIRLSVEISENFTKRFDYFSLTWEAPHLEIGKTTCRPISSDAAPSPRIWESKGVFLGASIRNICEVAQLYRIKNLPLCTPLRILHGRLHFCRQPSS